MPIMLFELIPFRKVKDRPSYLHLNHAFPQGNLVNLLPEWVRDFGHGTMTVSTKY